MFQLVLTKKIICLEIAEINPLLDNKGNKMAVYIGAGWAVGAGWQIGGGPISGTEITTISGLNITTISGLSLVTV